MIAGGWGGRRPALLTLALVAVLVLAVGLAGYLGVRYAHFGDGPSRLSGERDGFVSDAQRSRVLQVTEQFALRMDAINGADPKGYTDKIKELLTTKGKAAFDKEFAALLQVGGNAQTRGTGEVLATAVADIDADSATTMVVHDAAVTTPQGATGRHYRWSVSLQRVQGRWLVDSFTQVG